MDPILRPVVKPCIPFLGIYLNDIEHIQANNNLKNSNFMQKNQANNTTKNQIINKNHNSNKNTSSSPQSSQGSNKSYTQLSENLENHVLSRSKSSVPAYSKIDINHKTGPPTHLAKIRILIATLQGSDYLHITPNTQLQEFLLSFSYVEELTKVIEDAVYQTSKDVEPSVSKTSTLDGTGTGGGKSTNSKNQNQKQSKINGHNRASSAFIGSALGTKLVRSITTDQNINGFSTNLSSANPDNNIRRGSQSKNLANGTALNKKLVSSPHIDDILDSPENYYYLCRSRSGIVQQKSRLVSKESSHQDSSSTNEVDGVTIGMTRSNTSSIGQANHDGVLGLDPELSTQRNKEGAGARKSKSFKGHRKSKSVGTNNNIKNLLMRSHSSKRSNRSDTNGSTSTNDPKFDQNSEEISIQVNGQDVPIDQFDAKSVDSSIAHTRSGASSISSGFIDKSSAIVLHEKVRDSMGPPPPLPVKKIQNLSNLSNLSSLSRSNSLSEKSNQTNHSSQTQENSNAIDSITSSDETTFTMINNHCQGPVSRRTILKDGRPKRFARWLDYWMHLSIESGQILLYQKSEKRMSVIGSSSSSDLEFKNKRSNYGSMPIKQIDLSSKSDQQINDFEVEIDDEEDLEQDTKVNSSTNNSNQPQSTSTNDSFNNNLDNGPGPILRSTGKNNMRVTTRLHNVQKATYAHENFRSESEHPLCFWGV